MMNIESSETVLDGMIQALIALEQQQSYNIKNFLFSDGIDLYAYRRSSATDIYYFDAANDPGIPPDLSDSNHRVIMSTPPSEGLVSELPWVELADRTLLIFKGDGSTEIHEDFLTTSLEHDSNKPEAAQLKHAFPNPFNNRTSIPFVADESGSFTLNIFNLRGQLVFAETNSVNVRGKFDFKWSGLDSYGNELTSGSYIYQIRSSSENISTGKLLMLK